MGKYALVNPMLIGTMNTIVDADSSNLAAKELYNKMSPYFSNTQNLVFTIQKLAANKKEHQLGGGKAQYYDYKVKEVLKSDGEVVYTISTYSGKVNHAHLTNSIKNVLSKISGGGNLSDSEDEGSTVSRKKHKKSMKGGKHKKNHDDESDSFNRVLEELEEEEDEIFPKKSHTSKVTSALYPFGPATVYPYSYFPSFYVPNLVDPISYYWYNDIYLNTSRLYVPSFVSTISPRVVIDRSYVIESSDNRSKSSNDNTLSLSISLDD